MEAMFSAIVADLDGTIYRGDSPIPGAIETFEHLRDRGLDVCFFSNNPTRSRRAYAQRLREMGIQAAPSEILSAGTVTTAFLRRHHATDPIYVVGAPGLVALIEDAGLTLTETPERAEVLVSSWTDQFDYEQLERAYRAGQGETVFLGTDPDMLIPAAGGSLQPGSGAITHAIAGVLDRAPDRVLGKPSLEAVRMVRETLDCDLEDCLIVGDRLDTDIQLGERAGMSTAVVETGIAADLAETSEDPQPDHTLGSIGELPSLL